ncbi:pyridoxamine 5'-phosphate oxidase family protein [Lichenibacterium minor]|uniref:Pyridoxamine 5'-phosphate oxidase family protein n=1 Tax=Lichenibacterium minor TaxID=2316528 RepID=A0A4Q2U080_9HYPH|nr:MSMEG_1061 family FMN-dependent PPOX-type flavoprotein [Lichenibacterium minor]RYC29823.1 pyridoxamine 5'-phosphate oxidase family protein [Lichenibacterium minor]
MSRLDGHARAFIGLSPFLVIASADEAGRCDATPRGDAPGFVRVLDDRRLALPDRLGNRRVDTMLNVAANPQVGLVLMVPGIAETLRVNGRAHLCRDPDILAAMAVRDRWPTAALLVEIEEVFVHCGKAMIRSDLWNPEKRVPRDSFPTLGRIMADQMPDLLEPAAADRWIADADVTRLY